MYSEPLLLLLSLSVVKPRSIYIFFFLQNSISSVLSFFNSYHDSRVLLLLYGLWLLYRGGVYIVHPQGSSCRFPSHKIRVTMILTRVFFFLYGNWCLGQLAHASTIPPGTCHLFTDTYISKFNLPRFKLMKLKH